MKLIGTLQNKYGTIKLAIIGRDCWYDQAHTSEGWTMINYRVLRSWCIEQKRCDLLKAIVKEIGTW